MVKTYCGLTSPVPAAVATSSLPAASSTAPSVGAATSSLGRLGVEPGGDLGGHLGGADDRHRQQRVAAAELHARDTAGGPAHRPQLGVVGLEADRLALAGDQQDVVLGVDQLGADQLVVVLAEVDGDDAGLARGVVVAEAGLLDQPVAGREHEVGSLLVVADRQHLGDVLVGLEGQQPGHVPALGVARGLGEVVGLGAVDPPGRGEEQQPVVVGRGDEVLDHVVAAQGRAAHALAAALLEAVLLAQGPLGVAAAGDRDDQLLVGDEVLHREVPVGGDDLRTPLVAVLVDDLGELVHDDLPLARLVGQDVLEVGDDQLELGEPVHDLLALEGGEAAQLHLEDGVGLHLVDVQQRHQPGAGLLDVGAAADEGDDLVEGVERLDQAAVDVGLASRPRRGGSGSAAG